MKYTTPIFIISLIFFLSCKSDHSNQSTSTQDTTELDENELTRISMLMDPAPATYQDEQVNKLILYAMDHNWPVHKTSSGLLYWTKKKGNDAVIDQDDTVMVRYRGSLLNGQVFDQSPVSGEPVNFKVSDVIPAWQEALSLIGEDGEIIILAHSDLGYKSQQIANVIPAYSPLIFEIELIAIQK